jgi:hypothetical protein
MNTSQHYKHTVWVDMRLHESHDEGGFGVPNNTITRHAASYTTNTRFVAFLGTFARPAQQVWLPGNYLQDPSIWIAPPLCRSKVNPGSPLGHWWVPDFWRAPVGPRRKLGNGGSRWHFGKTWIPVQTELASTGPRTKLVNRGSPRPVFVFACAGQPDQIVNL